jgi:phenylacetic acid degradation operon negative regulatory protein
MTKRHPQCTARSGRRATRFETRVAALVARFAAQRPLRAGSLIVTVFGDIVAVRGGVVWLGSLISLLAPFGLSERLVRTAVHRLVREGWLRSERIGRRSYYRFSADGAARFDIAARKIYGSPRPSWDGRWRLVQLLRGAAEERDRARRELGWLGYVAIGPNVMVSPDLDRSALAAVRESGGVRMIDWVATPGGVDTESELRHLLERGLHLEELGDRYRSFVSEFAPVRDAAAKLRKLPPHPSLLVRILMIHEYRRIVLRDPRLPRDLWPVGWPAAAAFELCGEIYRQVASASELGVDNELESIGGELAPADEGFSARFHDAGD